MVIALVVRRLRRLFSGSESASGKGGPVLQLRERVALSAQVNLRGELLPVAGLREKLQAARQARCNLVVLASGNARGLAALCPGLEEGGGDGMAPDRERQDGAPDAALAAWIRDHVKLAEDVVDLLCLCVEGEGLP